MGWRGRLAALRPLTTLRARLILAFGAVIALSLFLTSGAFLYLVREYQAEREKDRLESVALTSSAQVALQMRRGATLEEISSQLDELSENARVRILLIDQRGLVLRDTEGNRLANRHIGLPSPLVPAQPFGERGLRPRVYRGVVETPAGEQVYAVVPLGPPGFTYRVAVIAYEATLTSAWRELLPRLALAALGALAVSVALASWLASTITRPLEEITHASEEMARGNYEQVNVVGGHRSADEIGRLAKAFNGMAREVARSHRAMRDLLANVSHDLRTPLTSIQGFAGALGDGTLAGGEGAREAGRVITEEAERMGRLVEDLLYLGRIETGELAIERQPVELVDLTRAAQLRFTFRAEQSGVKLALSESGTRVVALGDAHRLAQVLDNLLDNAFKHTPPGGQITLDARTQGDRALISVHNRGSVIPAADLERVFERFYQVDRSRTGAGGRGLGLAIARETVQAHGGTITAQSTPAGGTTFVVDLPLFGNPPEVQIDSAGARRRRAPSMGALAAHRR